MRNIMVLLTMALLALPAAGQGAENDTRSAQQVLLDARPMAVQIILDAVRSDDPWTRGEAIDASQWAQDRVLPIVQLGLEDPDPLVRYQALMVVGKRQLNSLGGIAAELVHDRSPSVRAAALFAAQATGRNVQMSPAQARDMIHAPNPITRSNVALALGLAGNRSALGVLSAMANSPMRRADPVQRRLMQLRVAEARLRLGKDDALDVIRWAAFGGPIELRVLAIGMMADTGDRAMQPALPPMLEESSVEVRNAAATALLRLGDAVGLPVLLRGTRFSAADAREQAEQALAQLREVQTQDTPRNGSSRTSDQAQRFTEQMDRTSELQRQLAQLRTEPAMQQDVAAAVRAQAAYGLSFADAPAAARRLAELLDDPHPQVRLAAAAAILRRLDR